MYLTSYLVVLSGNPTPVDHPGVNVPLNWTSTDPPYPPGDLDLLVLVASQDLPCFYKLLFIIGNFVSR